MAKKVLPKEVLSKEAKVKRIETNLKHKKAPTKSELEVQVKKLQLANDALEESLRQRIKLLESFEGKINNLEQQIEYLSCKEIMLCKETQTVSNLEFKCEECNFESETEKELAWHMGKHHGWPSDQKTEDMDISCSSQGVRYCVICDYEAEDMYDLEAHTWSEHEEVSIVDHNRWSLEVDDDVEEPSENSFTRLRDLMKHKKEQHTENVNICWNYVHSNCEFGDKRGWFMHTNKTD